MLSAGQETKLASCLLAIGRAFDGYVIGQLGCLPIMHGNGLDDHVTHAQR